MDKSGKVTVTAVWNEEYDDWYDDSGEEFYYEDNSGISDMLKEASEENRNMAELAFSFLVDSSRR